MSFRHKEAIEAFTEAIRLEPDAPNGYIGRAMAHRRLGNKPAARQDEERAKSLGGPERNAWERLCNRSRRKWGGDLDNEEWKHEDPLSRNAVLLDILAREVHAGCLWQWLDHGHWHWIDAVIMAARQIGTESANEVAAILEDLAPRLNPESLGASAYDEDDFDETGELRPDRADKEIPGPKVEGLDELDGRYLEVQPKFVKDVEEYFERNAPRAY
jgi:hypothetical protein